MGQTNNNNIATSQIIKYTHRTVRFADCHEWKRPEACHARSDRANWANRRQAPLGVALATNKTRAQHLLNAHASSLTIALVINKHQWKRHQKSNTAYNSATCARREHGPYVDFVGDRCRGRRASLCRCHPASQWSQRRRCACLWLDSRAPSTCDTTTRCRSPRSTRALAGCASPSCVSESTAAAAQGHRRPPATNNRWCPS